MGQLRWVYSWELKTKKRYFRYFGHLNRSLKCPVDKIKKINFLISTYIIHSACPTHSHRYTNGTHTIIKCPRKVYLAVLKKKKKPWRTNKEDMVYLSHRTIFSWIPWWLSGKEWNVRAAGSIPAFWRIPWRRKWQPTPVFSPGKSHGQRNLVGYSPRGYKWARQDLAIWYIYPIEYI